MRLNYVEVIPVIKNIMFQTPLNATFTTFSFFHNNQRTFCRQTFIGQLLQAQHDHVLQGHTHQPTQSVWVNTKVIYSGSSGLNIFFFPLMSPGCSA